jgi:hypothetical protein
MNKHLPFLFIAVLMASCASAIPTVERGNQVLMSTTWVATAVYKQVDGIADEGVNFVNDPVAQGTVSSARYGKDWFVFVPLDTESGEFDLTDVSALVSNNGKYELTTDENGKLIRRVYDTNFGYSHTRIITTLNNKLFTYIFDKDGDIYYVEHRPYRNVYPDKIYPEELRIEIYRLF